MIFEKIGKCGIICEYNPFHNGHEYHLKKTREILGNEADIICIMSGDFVQRAAPAFFDKRLRAKAAIEAGADCVIELPFLYATNGAAIFCHGAIQVLSYISGVKWLSFGVEGDVDLKILENIVDIQINESKRFKENLMRFLKEGNSYALARVMATTEEFDNKIEIMQILNKPNNILAIEYLIAIKRLQLNITPLLIKRTDKGYNSLELKPPFASASAIRGLIDKGQQFDKFVPKFVNDNFLDMKVNFKLFDNIARLALLKYYGDNTILLKLKNAASKNFDLNSIITSVKTKNLTYISLKRLILNVICGISNELSLYKDDFFTKLLFMKKSFAPKLKDLFPNILISANDEKRVVSGTKEAIQIYKLDSFASDLYSVITNQNSKRYFDKIF
ncbi:MAG: nucleotidyltransferase family protein [Firmicutes bacterium]|nr:nucleotidyltransferase family protein [Bacillota bacterium]